MPERSSKLAPPVFSGAANERKAPLEDFIWSLQDEPHCSRRAQILKKHPEVRELMGYEPLTKYVVLFLVALQLGLAYALRDMAFTWQFWVVAYVVGATANQALFLAIHEISHFLAFKSFTANKLFNFVANLPIVIPYSAAFRLYHNEHHKFQGVVGLDVDVPTALEARMLKSTFTKLLFCICQILFYALRPMVVRRQVFTAWHALNWTVQLAFDFALVHYFGWGPMFYLIASDFLAGSLHPCASHFIAEHYVFVGDVETYSYYGWLNLLCFNVGYHNEHHDFPNIAWTRLPKLRKVAAEFYDNIPQHKSWPLVLWKFITDPNVGGYNRVLRADKDNVGATTICGQVRADKDD